MSYRSRSSRRHPRPAHRAAGKRLSSQNSATSSVLAPSPGGMSSRISTHVLRIVALSQQAGRATLGRLFGPDSTRAANDGAAQLYAATQNRLAASVATGRTWMERLRRRAAASGQYAAHLLFPPTCLSCDMPWIATDGDELAEPAAGRLICAQCRASFGYRVDRICDRCAAPLPRFADPRNCPECQRRKLPFRAAIALGEYRGVLRHAVLRTKRAAYESLTLQLGEVLADRLEQLGWREQCDVVIPLPSHWWRRWTRGTSGPELLVESIAARLRLPAQTRWLACQRRTRKQGMLLPAERAENVRGAFAVRQPDAVRGQRILLVDDVMTTGATLKEAATALLRARASTVHIAVLARGTGD